MATVAKAMACLDSGLEVRDRMWLKITIANAFIGQDYLFDINSLKHSFSFEVFGVPFVLENISLLIAASSGI